jgi:hypothetical protein
MIAAVIVSPTTKNAGALDAATSTAFGRRHAS